MKKKDEIMKLSGRDLDAAVAEALGWDDISINPSTGHLNGTHRLQSTIIRELVPRYRTDIADAWKLVDELVAMGYIHNITTTSEGSETYFSKERINMAGMTDFYEAEGSIPPEAISRAFLLAMAGS